MNGGEIKAGNDLTVVTAAQRVEGSEPDNKGKILLGNVTGTVWAGHAITITTEDSLLHVDGTVTAAAGDVIATTKTGAIELAGDVTAKADVQENEGGNITARTKAEILRQRARAVLLRYLAVSLRIRT